MDSQHDSNLSHEAVKFYRDTFRLCPNYGRRQDIVSTVTDMELWKSVLNEWKEHKWNPLKINWMLSDYERRLAGGQSIGERKRSQEDMQARVSKRRQGNLSCVQEGAGIRLRTSRKTLEEVVTEALRENYRSEAKVK